MKEMKIPGFEAVLPGSVYSQPAATDGKPAKRFFVMHYNVVATVKEVTDLAREAARAFLEKSEDPEMRAVFNDTLGRLPPQVGEEIARSLVEKEEGLELIASFYEHSINRNIGATLFNIMDGVISNEDLDSPNVRRILANPLAKSPIVYPNIIRTVKDAKATYVFLQGEGQQLPSRRTVDSLVDAGVLRSRTLDVNLDQMPYESVRGAVELGYLLGANGTNGLYSSSRASLLGTLSLVYGHLTQTAMKQLMENAIGSALGGMSLGEAIVLDASSLGKLRFPGEMDRPRRPRGRG